MKNLLFTVLVTIAFTACKKSSSDDNSTPTPTPTACFTMNSPVYPGDGIDIVNCSQNATSFSWNFGDGTSISTETTPIHWYVDCNGSSATHTITLTVSDGAKTNSVSKTVTVVDPTEKFVGTWMASRATDPLLPDSSGYPMVITKISCNQIALHGILGDPNNYATAQLFIGDHYGQSTYHLQYISYGFVDQQFQSWFTLLTSAATFTNSSNTLVIYLSLESGTNSGYCTVTAVKQ